MEIEARGAPAHTRTLSVGISQDDARHWRVRGMVLDLRKRGLVPMAADLQTNGVIHQMEVDARVELAGPRFVSIRSEQPYVAFEPSEGTGGECCRDPGPRIEQLSGTPLDADYPSRLGAAIGGPRGCSHVLTAAQLLGSTVRTALEADAARFGAAPTRAAGQPAFRRSLSIDGLENGEHGLALVLQLSDVHLAPVGSVVDPMERLAGQREIRVLAEVDLGGMAVQEIRAAERLSDASDHYEAPWKELDVAFLVGHPALGGMARSLFANLPDSAEARPLRDTLLNLAPAVIQCIPALTQHWKRWREAGTSGEAGGGPGRMANGGMLDSCYMWRRDGHMGRRMADTLRGVAGD